MDEREEQREMAEALFDAVREGDPGRVRKLLAAGTDADAWGHENPDGDLPLQAAARLRTPDAPAIVEARSTRERTSTSKGTTDRLPYIGPFTKRRTTAGLSRGC